MHYITLLLLMYGTVHKSTSISNASSSCVCKPLNGLGKGIVCLLNFFVILRQVTLLVDKHTSKQVDSLLVVLLFLAYIAHFQK